MFSRTRVIEVLFAAGDGNLLLLSTVRNVKPVRVTIDATTRQLNEVENVFIESKPIDPWTYCCLQTIDVESHRLIRVLFHHIS